MLKTWSLLFLIIFLHGVAYGEEPGTLIGCVVDESGAPLPGVLVKARSAGHEKTAYTGSGGCYEFPTVGAGNYSLAFELSGFASHVIEAVPVLPGARTTMNCTLRISLQAEIVVRGRKPLRDLVAESDNLVGIADAASQGAVRTEQLVERPLLRPGEILEAVPGVIISQHSGQGKANQYYLRGFNLDHGTDIAVNVSGMPVNFPTHGHGQGYTDLNFLIPELVNDIQYKKGTYYAEEGDFSSAGAIRVDYASMVSNPVGTLEVGIDEYGRVLILGSPGVAGGQLLYGLELFHNNGPWDHPDDYRKINALLRYSRSDATSSFSLTAMGYGGDWDSTDQIARRAVDSGQIGRYGSLDTSDGGKSSRYSLSGDWHRFWNDAITSASGYLLGYRMNLYSNFTYSLDDPVNGDQFEQADQRWTGGFQVNHRWTASPGGLESENEAGLQFRNDSIGNVGLYHTKMRERLETIRQDEVTERNAGIYFRNTLRWTSFFRTVLGIRADYFEFDVRSNIAANSGTASDSIVSPKATLIFGPWSKTEYYLNYGYGYHSNDARGTTITVDPKTLEPVSKVDPLVRSKGAEIGLRSSYFSKWQTTLSLWRLDFDSELLFVGDAGLTEPSRPSRRTGIEWTNHYRALSWLTIDASYAYSRARFTDVDPAGNRIPGAVEGVFAAGFMIQNLGSRPAANHHTVGVISSPNVPQSYASGSRLSNLMAGVSIRYFGPRPLIEDNSVRSDASTLVNLTLGYRFTDKWNAFLDFFNVFDSRSSDIDYFYTSRLPGEPAEGIDDIHTHPVEPFSVRLSITRAFCRILQSPPDSTCLLR